MSGRYLVTGVQLGMLQALATEQEREDLVAKICDMQFIGNSSTSIEKDVELIGCYFK